MSRKLNLISYFGGKYPILNWLIDKFPAGDYHFIDLMCGSVITINDINDEVVNLFKVLRNDYDEFVRLLYFTPSSRAN